MANLSFSGEVFKIGVSTTGTGKNGEWTNTPIEVREVDCEHPNSMVFGSFDKDIADTITEGSLVDVFYNAKTNEFNGKTYNSLNIWKIEVKSAAPGTSNGQPAKTPTFKAPVAEDDLPF